MISIIVNAVEREVEDGTVLSFEDLVRLAHGEEADTDLAWTITWYNRDGGAGTIIKGQRLGLSGMRLVINVMDTSNA